MLRASVDPRLVYVVPNAVVASSFRPNPSWRSKIPKRSTSRIYRSMVYTESLSSVTIICISRLVYRKGIDLLLGAIPKICAMHPEVDFLIGANIQIFVIFKPDRKVGGDGPKIIDLEQMREKHQSLLADRVQLLGHVKHEEVRDVRCFKYEFGAAAEPAS